MDINALHQAAEESEKAQIETDKTTNANGSQGVQEEAVPSPSVPPPPPAEVDGPSWAAIEIRSKLLDDTFILCRREFFDNARERFPDKAIYIFPQEAHQLLAILEENGPEALKVVHSIKRECQGFILPGTHPAVEALESSRWFSPVRQSEMMRLTLELKGKQYEVDLKRPRVPSKKKGMRPP